MSTHSRAVRPNLEYYRKQAKALLRAAQSGDSDALQRLSRHGKPINAASLALHDAQFAIARERGFPSWRRFRAFIAESSLDDPGILDAFISAATSDLRRAEEILATHPGVAKAGYYAALVVGDWKEVDAAVTSAPSLATERGGPENVEPLIYVCFSRFAGARSARATDLTETARILLRHGANPSTAFTPENLPDNPLSCLYGATGLNNNVPLATVLLDAGANTNDGESLYHSTEHDDLECLKLLLQRGAAARGTNGLKHMLDRESLGGTQLLLEAGADPNDPNDRGETALHWAVWRGRSDGIIGALLDHGADIDARREDGRTAYALAVQSGQEKIAELLESRGANTELSPLDRYLGASASEPSGPSTGPKPSVPKESEHLLPDLTMSHRTEAVKALLAAGAPVDARGESGGTALHWACWKGYADLVEILINHQASLIMLDTQFNAAPSGWFAHGLQNCEEHKGDYPRVARLLIRAGAQFSERDLPTGVLEIDEIFREASLLPRRGVPM